MVSNLPEKMAQDGLTVAHVQNRVATAEMQKGLTTAHLGELLGEGLTTQHLQQAVANSPQQTTGSSNSAPTAANPGSSSAATVAARPKG